MFEWKVEEMLLTKGHFVYIDKTKIYSCENSVSREDKISFVDIMQDGKLSYIISLIEKFEKEKDSLPKDQYGNIKQVSLKAWIKRNDKKYDKPIIDNWYNHGRYNILGTERYIQDKNKGMYDFYQDLADECFHRQLKICEEEEKKYFSKHDEYSILEEKFKEKQNQYKTTFGAEIWIGSNGVEIGSSGKNRKLTIDELKDFLSKYEQIDNLVEKLTEETRIVY